MNWIPDQPYNDLPLLPPAQALETKRVLKRCITARAALAELKQAAELIPYYSMLTNTMPLLEAKDSCAIENLGTTADQVSLEQIFLNSHLGKEAHIGSWDALRLRNALRWIDSRHLDRRLSAATAGEIHQIIEGRIDPIRYTPTVCSIDAGDSAATYTPPEGKDRIWKLLRNWEWFLRDKSKGDPLIRMAAGHYQFKAIHPFADGVGKTGRAVDLLYLSKRGLLTKPVLNLSRYIAAHKAEYHRLFLDVTREQAWKPWLLFMLQAVEETSRWTLKKILAIQRLAEDTASHIRRRLPEIYSHELLEAIFAAPYCRVGDLLEVGIAHRTIASRYLKAFAELGVLEEITVGNERIFVHPKLMQLLTSDS